MYLDDIHSLDSSFSCTTFGVALPLRSKIHTSSTLCALFRRNHVSTWIFHLSVDIGAQDESAVL